MRVALCVLLHAVVLRVHPASATKCADLPLCLAALNGDVAGAKKALKAMVLEAVVAGETTPRAEGELMAPSATATFDLQGNPVTVTVVDVKDDWDKTPLHYAALLGGVKEIRENEQMSFVKDFVQSGSSIESWMKQRPFAFEFGEEVTDTPGDGRSAHFVDVVDYLTRSGADINSRDEKQRTALHAACVGGSPAILQTVHKDPCCERLKNPSSNPCC